LLERTFGLKKFELTPYGGAEAFWDGHHEKWRRFEFTGGVQMPFLKKTSLDFYYSRARCVTCVDPHTNIFGVSLNIYLKLKKK
jgi:hypothetical protein